MPLHLQHWCSKAYYRKWGTRLRQRRMTELCHCFFHRTLSPFSCTRPRMFFWWDLKQASLQDYPNTQRSAFREFQSYLGSFHRTNTWHTIHLRDHQWLSIMMILRPSLDPDHARLCIYLPFCFGYHALKLPMSEIAQQQSWGHPFIARCLVESRLLHLPIIYKEEPGLAIHMRMEQSIVAKGQLRSKSEFQCWVLVLSWTQPQSEKRIRLNLEC